MGKRRKNRTHKKDTKTVKTGVPKTFVVRHGQVGHSITQLVRDMRKVMEPNTASRLKERSRNKLKDYLIMGPALEVTHLLAFSLTDKAPHMKIVKLSAGPTLSFRIQRYSLMKDVASSKKRKRSVGLEYLSAPLLVLAAFPPQGSSPPHLSLLMKSFQSLFPPLTPQTLSLSSARRVVLVHYNADRDTVDIRHYIITVRASGVSRQVRKIIEGPKSRLGSVLDLGGEQDVADYILKQGGDGYESASSAASDIGEDGETNKIELTSKYVGRNNKKGEQRSVRLDEVGPRMELKLLKISEGVPGKEGAVIWHRFVKKTKAEEKKLAADHAEREKLRKQRRLEQEANVRRKKEANGQGEKNGEDEDEDMASEQNEDAQSEEEDDEGEWDDDEEMSDAGDGIGDDDGSDSE